MPTDQVTGNVVAALDCTLAARTARQALQVHIDAIYDAIHAHGRPHHNWMFEQFDRLCDELAESGQALCNCGGPDGFHEPLDEPECSLHKD